MLTAPVMLEAKLMVQPAWYGAVPPAGRVDGVAVQVKGVPDDCDREKVTAPVGAVPAISGVTVAVRASCEVATMLADEGTTPIFVPVGFTCCVKVAELEEKLASPVL